MEEKQIDVNGADRVRANARQDLNEARRVLLRIGRKADAVGEALGYILAEYESLREAEDLEGRGKVDSHIEMRAKLAKAEAENIALLADVALRDISDTIDQEYTVGA